MPSTSSTTAIATDNTDASTSSFQHNMISVLLAQQNSLLLNQHLRELNINNPEATVSATLSSSTPPPPGFPPSPLLQKKSIAKNSTTLVTHPSPSPPPLTPSPQPSLLSPKPSPSEPSVGHHHKPTEAVSTDTDNKMSKQESSPLIKR